MRLNRRAFLRAGGAVGLLAGCALGAGGAESPGRAPSLIIDTHTHFYDPARPEGVPWPGKDEKRLYRTVLPKDYKSLPQPVPVAGTVVVEASPWVEDNQWILDLAARESFIVGFVGNLPVGTKRFPDDLRRFSQNRIFRGLRVSGGQLREKTGDKAYENDLRDLADRGLSLDVVGDPEMLPAVEELAGKIPQLRVIIDHVAGVKIDGKTPPPVWTNDIAKAAGHPNVFCKISGLVEGAGKRDGTTPARLEFYQPTLETLWKSFGPECLIYGSNWPVSDLFAPCSVVQQIVLDFARSKGPQALENLFWKNAQAAYKWAARDDSQKPAV